MHEIQLHHMRLQERMAELQACRIGKYALANI